MDHEPRLGESTGPEKSGREGHGLEFDVLEGRSKFPEEAGLEKEGRSRGS
jgi:hypothetical protein